MENKITTFGRILKKTYKGWSADDPLRQSASIAYYAIFSLPALLVLIINVVGFVFEKEAVNGEISRQIEGAMGGETAKQVSDMVKKAGEAKAGLIPGIIAIITIVFGATGVFAELQKSLNIIWDVKQKENISFAKKIKGRLFSFGLIVSIGFLLLVSLFVSSGLAAMSHWLEKSFPNGIAYLFYLLEFFVSISVISVLFALMFKFLPDVKIPWRNVWAGAILTGVFFIIGKYGLSIYFGKAQPASVYGAAGSIVLLLLWVSYSSMIVFFGAEFTKQYAMYHNIKIEPKKNAEKITVENNKNIESNPYQNENPGTTDDETARKNKPDNKVHKIKSKKELKEKIESLEKRLSTDKKNIKDDLSLSHIFGNFIPKGLRVKSKANKKLSMHNYLQGVAENHISEKPQDFIERFKKLISSDKDGSN